MSRKYSTKEAVKFLEASGTPFTCGTLNVWRSKKTGPAYIKIRSRVFYTEAALIEFTRGLEVKTIDTVES